MRQEILTFKGNNNKQIIDRFNDYFQPDGNLIFADGNIHIFIIEKFFFRTGYHVAAMVLFEQKNQNLLLVHIYIAGGSDMFGISLGAQKSMLKNIRNFLIKMGEYP